MLEKRANPGTRGGPPLIRAGVIRASFLAVATERAGGRTPRDDAACTTMRPRSRSQDPREESPRDRAARHADAGNGRPPGD